MYVTWSNIFTGTKYFYWYEIFLCQTTHGSDVLHVGVVLSVAVQPGHVEPGAGPVQTVQREPGAGVDMCRYCRYRVDTGCR